MLCQQYVLQTEEYETTASLSLNSGLFLKTVIIQPLGVSICLLQKEQPSSLCNQIASAHTHTDIQVFWGIHIAFNQTDVSVEMMGNKWRKIGNGLEQKPSTGNWGFHDATLLD